MTIKPTPGPWKWSEDKWHGGYSGLYGPNWEPVLVPQHENDGDDGAAWFETHGDAGEETLTEANARLIAKAPEMRDMLEAIANTADNADDDFEEYRHPLRCAVHVTRTLLGDIDGQD